ncbi:hypothetical protein Hypma_008713 [Hypsizygus marmoreus]|uniref:RRM domain-containing protein n=1 Tax=Hypsizygus marmoreus TaxID=39966 RepID=A0A369JV72_HYPMA|nr:hypothetical protein Hypma_008713 [Hypsizygus marmoreus]
MSAGGVASNVARVARTSRPVPLETRRHILLKGIAPTATTGDVKRAIAGKLNGVASVAINYWRFGPSGRALITLTQSDFMQENLRALNRLTIAGIPAKAQAIYYNEAVSNRTRGVKGRAEAVERGFPLGTGPWGNYPNHERNVVIWGLPGKLTVDALEANALEGFKVARSKDGKAMIIKVPLPETKFTFFSRFVVTMSSVSEAHRLVRRLHSTSWDKEGMYPVKARLLY